MELAAYDADDDLILEDDRGFVQVAQPASACVVSVQVEAFGRYDHPCPAATRCEAFVRAVATVTKLMSRR